MINKHFKLEGKSLNVWFNFKKIKTKILRVFKANSTLKIKVKVTSFQTCPRPLCDQYNIKLKTPQEVSLFTRNHTMTPERKIIRLPPPIWGGGGGHDIIPPD